MTGKQYKTVPSLRAASRFSALPLLLAVCATVQADQAPQPEEMVVISSRVPVPMRQIGTSVSVITEHELQAHGNLALHDVLRQQPAMASSNSGGVGKTTTLRIRGEEGFRTLTILDGLRLLDPSGPQVSPQMEHLLSSGVTRVEILRGPQGLAYGADAGGVVNISSRRSEAGWIGEVDAQYGRYDTRQFGGFISGNTGSTDIYLSATDFSTEGFNARSSDTVLQDRDGYENTTLHGSFGWQATDALYLQVVHRDIDGYNEHDGCFSTITFSTVHDCHNTTRQRASRVAAFLETAESQHELGWSTTRTRNASFSEGLPAFDSRGELDRLEYVGSYRGFDQFTLAFGADHEKIGFARYDRENLGVFVEYLSDFSEVWFVTAGLRYDDNDDFGRHTSYRVSTAYLYDIPGNEGELKFRSSLGSGFRAPSPYEIDYNNRPGVYPPAADVDLKQEESRGYEVGVEYRLDHTLQLEAVYFDQRVKDAITFDMATWSGYLQDSGTGRSRGYELNGRLSISPNWDLRSNYTWNRATQADGQARLRRPRHLANIGASWYATDNRLSLNAFYRISRDSVDTVGAERVKLDSVGVLDLSASYQVNELFSLYARLENATDRTYQEVFDYNTPGRSAYVGARLRFSGR